MSAGGGDLEVECGPPQSAYAINGRGSSLRPQGVQVLIEEIMEAVAEIQPRELCSGKLPDDC